MVVLVRVPVPTLVRALQLAVVLALGILSPGLGLELEQGLEGR